MKKAIWIIVMLLVITAVNAQEKITKSKEGTEKIKFELKDGENPDIYIDGKKYGPEIVDLLDADKILSITVLKGEEALKQYQAPNGVILITTKLATTNATLEKQGEVKVRIRQSEEDSPLVIIDGKKASQEDLKKLDPNQIESINVYKGEKAMELYKSPNGVIVVKTKS